MKVGEATITRGFPPVDRTLEVIVDEDWLASDKLEKCVTFREASTRSGVVVVTFSRSITSAEARVFAELLLDAARVLDQQIIDGKGAQDPNSTG